MKLIVSKVELNEAIQHVSKAVSYRTSIPILSGIKIETIAQQLVLTASDTEISIQSFIPFEKDDQQIVELIEAGSVVLPAKFFVEIIKKLPKDTVSIEVHPQFQTVIRSGSSEIQLSGLDPEEFPVLPQIQENQVLNISSDRLRMMISQTLFATSSNESTPILTGILWSIQDGNLKFTATDRHRLASRHIALEHMPETGFNNIVIAGKTLNELNKILSDQAGMIDIVVTDSQVLFRMESILLYTRILEGTYPDTSKIIPQTYKTELIVRTDELLAAIDRAYLLSREDKTNVVNLITLPDSRIEITSGLSELGKITEQCDVDNMQGEPLKISFNSKYMIEALKTIEEEKLHVCFTGAMSPIVVKPVERDNALHLILPFRTSGS